MLGVPGSGQRIQHVSIVYTASVGFAFEGWSRVRLCLAEGLGKGSLPTSVIVEMDRIPQDSKRLWPNTWGLHVDLESNDEPSYQWAAYLVCGIGPPGKPSAGGTFQTGSVLSKEQPSL